MPKTLREGENRRESERESTFAGWYVVALVTARFLAFCISICFSLARSVFGLPFFTTTSLLHFPTSSLSSLELLEIMAKNESWQKKNTSGRKRKEREVGGEKSRPIKNACKRYEMTKKPSWYSQYEMWIPSINVCSLFRSVPIKHLIFDYFTTRLSDRVRYAVVVAIRFQLNFQCSRIHSIFIRIEFSFVCIESSQRVHFVSEMLQKSLGVKGTRSLCRPIRQLGKEMFFARSFFFVFSFAWEKLF